MLGGGDLVVLLDLLPDETAGARLSDDIRLSAELTEHRPRVVGLTRVGHSFDHQALAAAGIERTLYKPPRPKKLVAALFPEDPDHTPIAARRNRRGRYRILVADDNPINQKVAIGQLRSLGHSAEAVADGMEVLVALKSRQYDLILMDCQMPGMNGYDATAEIRRRYTGDDRRPVVAMTAGARAADRERCLAAGMDDYLPKPVTIEQLEMVLNRWLGTPPEALQGAVVAAMESVANPILDPLVVASLRLLQQGARGVDLHADVVVPFMSAAPERLKSIRNATASGDWEMVRRTVHTLRGSAGTLGATRISEVCLTLEDAAEIGKSDADALNNLADELQDACAALDLAFRTNP